MRKGATAVDFRAVSRTFASPRVLFPWDSYGAAEFSTDCRKAMAAQQAHASSQRQAIGDRRNTLRRPTSTRAASSWVTSNDSYGNHTQHTLQGISAAGGRAPPRSKSVSRATAAERSQSTNFIIGAVSRVMTLNPDGSGQFARLSGLGSALEQCDGAFRERFATSVLPWMAELLNEAPTAFGAGLPLLTRLFCEPTATTPLLASVVLSERQVATLLVLGFFSLFPHRSEVRAAQVFGQGQRPVEMPSFNFGQLLGTDEPSAVAKVRCLLQYFDASARELGPGQHGASIEYLRLATGGAAIAECMRHGAPVPLARLDYLPGKPIEQCEGMAQADFSNEWLGGGALRYGCVQEEILFVTKPQLLVGMLLCERMGPHEAIAITGARQFSLTTGYASTFAFAGEYSAGQLPQVALPELPRWCLYPPAAGRQAAVKASFRDTVVVAFDAVDYSRMPASEQYRPERIEREVRKAMAAVEASQHAAGGLARAARGFATGGWGCGVFGGHHALKFCIQWVAASLAGCPQVAYCTPVVDVGAPLPRPLAKGWPMDGVEVLRDTFISAQPSAQRVMDRMLSFSYHMGASAVCGEEAFVQYLLDSAVSAASKRTAQPAKTEAQRTNAPRSGASGKNKHMY